MPGYGNNTVMWQISVVQTLSMIIPTQINFEWARIPLKVGSDFNPNIL